jgi:hypothetical protein
LLRSLRRVSVQVEEPVSEGEDVAAGKMDRRSLSGPPRAVVAQREER